MSESETKKPGLRKQRVGVVKSTGMNKTIVVEYINRVPHPKFKKIIKQSKKFYAHDEKEESGEGDTVEIIEATPRSKTKRWELVRIIEKSRVVDVAALRAAAKAQEAAEKATSE